MDLIPRDEYSASMPTAEEARKLLSDTRQAVLAMATGGCARYAFSFDVPFCLDRQGNPLIHYASTNPHHHLIITNTTMDLRLVHRLDAEGNELSLLLLTGMLHLVDPSDHDSLDRHARYFAQPIENYTRGTHRLYRLVCRQLYFEQFNGERVPFAPAAVLERNSFSPREELRLLEFAQRQLDSPGCERKKRTAVGIDGRGADVRSGTSLLRFRFEPPVSGIDQAELALSAIGSA